jgi:hypothetical protein
MLRFAPVLPAAFLTLAPAAALADMSFYIVNDHRRDIALEFVSRNSDQIWPGGDKVYMIEGSRKKSIPIDCAEGERICYGAWQVGNDRVTWGIGPDRNKSCVDCCRICLSSGTDNIHIAD